MSITIEAFHHEPTSTFSYVVADPASLRAAIVDPVLDYDFRSGRMRTTSADRIVDYARSSGLTVDWILETHAHADHLTAAPYLKSTLGGRIAIGEGILKVQATFRTIFNLGDFVADGSDFDHLFADDEAFRIGSVEARVLATPGHTNDSVSYLIEDAVFVGDTLFAPDYGTARADFPGGDARMLYRSLMRLYALPDSTRAFLCHDYPPQGRPPEYVHTIAEQRAGNVHAHVGVGEDEFVRMREDRDAGLAMPNLIIPSVQVNIRAGHLPPAEANGTAYLKVPVNRLGRPAADDLPIGDDT